MSSVMKPVQRIISLFSQKPCWKIEPLAAKLKYSIPSVRRFLSQKGYFTSFTHNASWYTLRSIPRFNSMGLWFYHDIGFSRTGSLTDTLIDLTGRSSSGMTAKQLGEELHCRCHSVLVHLCRCEKLQRKKVGGSYVYLSIDPHTATNQCHFIDMKGLGAKHLPAEIAVLVLAEFIHHPESSFEQLAEAIAHRKGVSLNVSFIESLFDLHDLKKKMKIAVQRL